MPDQPPAQHQDHDKVLIYFADPMCSWCWGFAPVMENLLAEFPGRFTLRLVMAGLHPAPGRRLSDTDRNALREHWESVQQQSGAAFDFRFFEREHFVYNTEPAARAVIAARILDDAAALPMLIALQHAFYARNHDITRRDTLLQLAAEQGLGMERFRQTYDSDDCLLELKGHFRAARRVNVEGLPTLYAVDANGSVRLTGGYLALPALRKRIDCWLRVPAPDQPARPGLYQTARQTP